MTQSLTGLSWVTQPWSYNTLEIDLPRSDKTCSKGAEEVALSIKPVITRLFAIMEWSLLFQFEFASTEK